MSLEAFEADLKNNLCKIWNRMSSGSYMPPPVRAVEIPEAGGGVRVLGVPAIGDRVAQAVVAARIEAVAEPVFRGNSYGYRPGRSPHDAVGACRERCWKYDWVIDLDVAKFFGTVPHDLVLKAVGRHVELPWVLLCVRRWLTAPLQMPDGSLAARDRGTPQGSLQARQLPPAQVAQGQVPPPAAGQGPGQGLEPGYHPDPRCPAALAMDTVTRECHAGICGSVTPGSAGVSRRDLREPGGEIPLGHPTPGLAARCPVCRSWGT